MTPTEDNKIDVSFTTSRGISDFLGTLRISIAISTYQTGNLFLIGPDKNDSLFVSPLKIERAMGLCSLENSLFVVGRKQVWRFNNILPKGTPYEGKDRIFIPQVAWTTGDIDGHDIAVEKSGRVALANTLYSCVVALSESESFTVIWKPPCVSELTPEDRCHLNGVAIRDGKVRYVTTFSESNVKQGWRDDPSKNGVIWDIQSNRKVATGLTMPHSPRWYKDSLWCLQSGDGAFGRVNLKTNSFEPFAKIPGFARGLTFAGDYALIGSSYPRKGNDEKDPGLRSLIAGQNLAEVCGVFIVDLSNKKIIHYIQISEAVQEIFDIAIIHDSLRPWAYDIESEESGRMLRIG
jgi:uncharacterized protein (TIGR03032 family)